MPHTLLEIHGKYLKDLMKKPMKESDSSDSESSEEQRPKKVNVFHLHDLLFMGRPG